MAVIAQLCRVLRNAQECADRATSQELLARPVIIHEAGTSNYAITMHHRDKLVIQGHA